MQKKILISACLLGKNCRYDGGHSQITDLDETNVNWIPVCPEEAGGLGTPRPAAEMQNSADKILEGKGSIININGQDVSQNFINGAEESLEMGLLNGVEFAILKSRSPSCGMGQIYDGTFTGTVKQGDGIFAHLCQKAGITCISSDETYQIKKTLSKPK